MSLASSSSVRSEARACPPITTSFSSPSPSSKSNPDGVSRCTDDDTWSGMEGTFETVSSRPELTEGVDAPLSTSSTDPSSSVEYHPMSFASSRSDLSEARACPPITTSVPCSSPSV
ncbi:hypothetical protein BLNAU_13726 [Blattamonas nauphoetae]|uniref:Uncharacterized protein n=1 Tax=Blattamonas nauphoetae TaxID=2049346 RepID=A0ABQ9XIZ2_9EUKA|nr:hypothetical protein BLNAU_13726 [Blattamonas nauphoetae]